MTMTKGKLIGFTVLATLLYILIEYAVGENPFGGPVFGGDYLFSEDTSWLRWLALIAIPVLGILQAMQLGDREVDVDEYDTRNEAPGQVNDPAWWRALSGNSWWSILWLPLRFVLGIHWLTAGWHKTQDPGWATAGETVRNGETMMMERGDSMKFYLANALGINPMTGEKLVGDDGEPVPAKVAFGWYGDFLHWIWDGQTSWFGPLVAWGEVLVGLGLLVGGLVGIAAFFGTLMNMSFMLAGTTSANPWMFGMTVFLILGWKVAGYLGLDKWFLSYLRTPWDRRHEDPVVAPATAPAYGATHAATPTYGTTHTTTTTPVPGATVTVRPDDNKTTM